MIKYKKALANILFYQAVGMSKEELQDILFVEEETTKNWTLEKCRFQYVKDQLEFIEGGNLDDEINHTWHSLVSSKEYLERRMDNDKVL